jgi:hypothetical protein
MPAVKNESCYFPRCDRCWTAVVNFLDLRLLLDPVYVNISVGISFSLICMLQFFAFFPILVLDLGYSKGDTAIFIAVCNAMDLVGRLVIALVGILNPNFSSRSLFMVGTVTTVAGRLGKFATVVSIYCDN